MIILNIFFLFSFFPLLNKFVRSSAVQLKIHTHIHSTYTHTHVTLMVFLFRSFRPFLNHYGIIYLHRAIRPATRWQHKEVYVQQLLSTTQVENIGRTYCSFYLF